MNRAVTGWVDVDGGGSHVLFAFRYRADLVAELKELPGRIWLPDDRLWAVPAVPAVLGPLRVFLARWRGFAVHERAEALLTFVEDLPSSAAGVLHRVGGPDDPAWVLAAEYDEELVAAVKRIPGRAYDRPLRRWWFDPGSGETAAGLRRLTEEFAIAVTEAAQEALDSPGQAVTGRDYVQVSDRAGESCAVDVVSTDDGARWLVGCAGCHRLLREEFRRRAPEATGDYADCWAVLLDADVAPLVVEVLADASLELPEQAVLEIADLAEEGRRRSETAALSAAATSDFYVHGLAQELRPFQRAGVEYALRARRTFIGDEQGLGKTVQALAALHAAAAWPAIVVCPASLRLNWEREARRWLPARTVEVLGAGRGPSGDADLYVLNYDSLHKWVGELTAAGVRAVVLDESHFCKNAKARRTRAAKELVASLPGDGLLLLLTGTPVLNRPGELMPQLTLMGRLQELGGYDRFRHVYSRGRELDRLHRDLRSTCFVRRRKEDVLPQLPAKQRTVVPVEIDNLDEYRAAEADVVAYLREQAAGEAAFLRSIEHLSDDERRAAIRLRGEDAAVRAARAEPLVRLTKLKLLAARGKLRAAVDWTGAFLASGEKLVLFCHHVEISDALLAAFSDAVHLIGADSAEERQAQIDRFQHDDACRLIVCSDKVGGVGVTLTAASNVAFLELGWNPAAHDQAEDRLHRIGQERAVSAWYLLAAGTIDEKIAELVEEKRALVDACADGKVQEHGSVLGDLVAWLVAGGRSAPVEDDRSPEVVRRVV